MRTARGFTLSARSARAFTLIELLVVIAITAILGVVAFVNFKDFAQDQILNKAQGQIQTYLRLAQANATAGVICNNQGGADWRVRLDTDIGLECSTNNFENIYSIKTLTLENVKIASVGSPTCSAVCSNASCLPLYVSYSKLSGSVKIKSDVEQTSCLKTSNQILINIKNLKTDKIKSFTISKGGAIDAQ